MDWLLDPTITHLNHGSYGACPRRVVDVWQGWQRELERNATDFLWRRLPAKLDEARVALADFVGAEPADLTLVRNATSGLNAAIRSLRLEPGDEVVTTPHEYGALLRTWAFVGVRPVVVEPDALAAAIGRKTRVVFLSHITSETARVLPVAEICSAARLHGALSIIDGAHAPGHIPLDLAALGADVYAGNCHKWLCAPKGAAFLWARPEHQSWLEPVVTSWGWEDGAVFSDKHEWQGTFDPSAWLTVPTAIETWRSFDHPGCREVAARGQALLPPLDGHAAPQMWSSEVHTADADALRQVLFARYRIEAPVFTWAGRALVRVSVAPYTTDADVQRLVTALEREQALPT